MDESAPGPAQSHWPATLLVVIGVLLMVFYVPAKRLVLRLGVPSGATPWPVLAVIVVCWFAGARLYMRRKG